MPKMPLANVLQYCQRGHYFFARIGNRFLADRCILEASALAYATLLAIVPLAALGFSMFATFSAYDGLMEHVQSIMLDYLAPASREAFAKYLQQIPSKMGALSVFGIIGLLVTSIALINAMEAAFNRIWRVDQSRSLVARFMAFWTMLTLAPLLFGVSISITSYFTAMPLVSNVTSAASSVAGARFFVPWLMSSLALSAAYLWLPNTSVSWRAASIASFMAGALFEFSKNAFGYYVAHVANYEQVYGALGTLPIFLLWLFVIWVIVLLGAEIAYCLQHKHFSEKSSIPLSTSLYSAHRLMMAAATASDKGELLTISAAQAHLENDLNISEEQIRLLLIHLQKQGLLHHIYDEQHHDLQQEGWLLARSATHCTLWDIYLAMQVLDISVPQSAQDSKLGVVAQQQYQQMNNCLQQQMQQVKLVDS
ncbi:MAG: YihY family inner membrane protein [Mariprofundales bacterium]